ncbi:FKBP12-interacting protein of 37 kDa [Striga asiatica]|uniref:FKBP12-interacting protein of 37 kDa n=1 Tax=Striga asiatica TaxID=4170 RepID=A0A5A7RI53_STRAF|nr:FKBP12-interacting protein of 37 kDa [Striga asiatica]
MASDDHLDVEDDFGGDFAGGSASRRSGNKRSFARTLMMMKMISLGQRSFLLVTFVVYCQIDVLKLFMSGPLMAKLLKQIELNMCNAEYLGFHKSLNFSFCWQYGSDKVNQKIEETAPGVATGMILSLHERKMVNKEKIISKLVLSILPTDVLKVIGWFPFSFPFCSLKNCQDELSRCQMKLEDAKSEIQKWHFAFQNESFIPQGATPEPKFVVNYLQILRSSEDSLREQSALRDLRTQLKPPSMQARRQLLDPAIHEEFTRLKDKKVKELQDNIAAVSFTPQSKMGKMLMAKCRTLQEENEEIGDQANEGKMHELAMKLASQKSQNTELRSQLEGICKQMEKLTGDVDRSNELVVILLEKLEAMEDEIQRLKNELRGNAMGESRMS